MPSKPWQAVSSPSLVRSRPCLYPGHCGQPRPPISSEVGEVFFFLPGQLLPYRLAHLTQRCKATRFIANSYNAHQIGGSYAPLVSGSECTSAKARPRVGRPIRPFAPIRLDSFRSVFFKCLDLRSV
jgi:hypothetical protein